MRPGNKRFPVKSVSRYDLLEELAYDSYMEAEILKNKVEVTIQGNIDAKMFDRHLTLYA